MSSVIAAEYEKESDKLTLAYYDRAGEIEKRVCRISFSEKGFLTVFARIFRGRSKPQSGHACSFAEEHTGIPNENLG
jgi:hypothetical protein